MSVTEKIVKRMSKEVEEVNESEKRAPKTVVIASSTADCPYPVLEREIFPEKITCPKCGGLTLEGYVYCDRCGAKIEV